MMPFPKHKKHPHRIEPLFDSQCEKHHYAEVYDGKNRLVHTTLRMASRAEACAAATAWLKANKQHGTFAK